MANYLPVLLVSVTTNSIPDDSAVSTLPRGQVDYLSHNWEEEDVWRSWRNMTRQKNEIANGIRLENASWRTWWKQRNKLKTVTPEKLNWLKDSDVTWLYGPLHTAVDWTPPPKPKPDPVSVDDKNPSSAHDRLDLNLGPSGMKPILKHRSICELLTSDLPSSPIYSSPGSDADKGDVAEDDWIQDEDIGDGEMRGSRSRRGQERPPLLHTKSDTHIARGHNRMFRRDSPPRIIAEGSTASPTTPGSTTSGSSYAVDRKSSTTTQRSQTPGSDQEPPSGVATNGPGKKKHITFNTFVEQCIAIEKPKGGQDGSACRTDTPRVYDSGYDDGYDEDTESGVMEDEEDDVLFTGHSISSEQSEHDHFDTHSNSDSDDEDDDEVLEIRTTSIRQRPGLGRSSSSSSSSGSSRSPSAGGAKRYNPAPTAASRSFRYGPALLRTPSAEKEHMTILPIAPTILKTRGVGNGSEADDDYDYPVSVTDGAKWYGRTDVPVHLVYVPPLGSNYSMDGSELHGGENVYRHREAYFSVGTGGGIHRSIPNVGVTPSPTSGQATVFYQTPIVASPVDGDGAEEDAYDYFEGPDLGVTFLDKRTHSQHTMRQEERDDDAAGARRPDMVRYAEGGAASVVGGRNSGTPQVVVKGVNEEGRERERSRSRSRSRTPSPAELAATSSGSSIPPPSAAVAVPRVGSSHAIDPPTSSSNNSSLLSPPNIMPSRGRSSTPVSENQPRGRSVTRNSSFSDRERSGSRGTSSPIGSISPEGSAVGIAIGSAYGVYANGRDRDSTSRQGRSERGRVGRRDHNAGVDDVRTSSLGRFGDGTRGVSTASNSSISSGSSTASGASTAVPAHGSPLRISTDSFDLGPAMSTPMSIPIPKGTEEEQLQRSRHPTPGNSPVSSIKHSLLVPPPQPSSPTTTVPRAPKGIVSPPGSPTSVKALDDGTLVGRAVDIVSTAGAFLGSIWQTNART